MIALPTHSAPKMLYIKRAMPEIYAAAYKLMGIQDYLLCALTGNFVTDRSLASRSMLMDMRSGRWSPRLAEIFEVSGEKLCELLPTGTVCGCVTEKAAALTGIPAGTPVITCGGDQQSAVLGLGVRSPGTAVINIGTGSYAAAVSESYVDSGDSGVSVLRSAVEGKWLLEASAPSAGDAVKWFCSAFYDDPTAYERITSDAEKAKPGAGGVVASCSINGTGTPGWNTAVRGFFAGISAGTGRAEMARALLEAIAADAAENLTAAERLSGCAGKVRAAGGITGTPLFRQMLCDTIGRPVEFTADSEATSLGAWATAAAAMGLFGSAGEAADAVAPERETFLPNMENHEAYKAANERRKMEEK
jgi:xylulokinase/glycerol kinase